MGETVSKIGEFGLIARIDELIREEGIVTPGLVLGIGDDAASVLPDAGHELLITCDCMVEGRHFLPKRIDPLALGRRAMVSNISDIGAMGGRPLYALVSLGLKSQTLVSDVEDMYRGFLMELNPFGASIIGGNVTKSEPALFIDMTLIGQAEKGRIVRRSTAKIGDAILTTGYPGESAAGLEMLKAHPKEDLSKHPLVRAFNSPSHRAREGEAIAQSGHATAMIDTSDGFLGDLGHICQQSGKGAIIALEKLPVREESRLFAAESGRDPYELLLRESDDYELIITCSRENVTRVRSAVAALSDIPVNEVGKIVDASEGIKLIHPDGTQRMVSPLGWDHFSD
ncbi:MAG: thiamine-phosphate kinase [Deltaproteobacteria bacterium]|nr:thiamine-phosphate kinase [Deltaproteobacteria bacterium]